MAVANILSPERDFLPIEEQIESIGNIFNLDPRPALRLAKTLPPIETILCAERWFAIPKETSLFPFSGDMRLKHCMALDSIRKLLSEQLKFSDFLHFGWSGFLKGQSARPENFLMTKKTEANLLVIGMEQPGDIILVPARLNPPPEETEEEEWGAVMCELFGETNNRRPGIIVRNEVYLNGELVYSCDGAGKTYLESFVDRYGFSLDAFSFGSILLTHKNLLEQWSEYGSVRIECYGNRFDMGGSGTFEKVPVFTVIDGQVGLALTKANPGKDDNMIPREHVGLATGFLGAYGKS